MDTKIAVVGVPSSAGAHGAGTEKAPSFLRKAGVIDRLRLRHPDLIDCGDSPTVTYKPDLENPKQRNLPAVREVITDIAGRVDDAIQNGCLPLVLGGDCTITLGVLAALTKHFESVGLIYFDGDLDLNIPEVSPSGIFDGMGLAHIIGKGALELTHIGPRYPLLSEERVVAFAYNPEAGWTDPYELETAQRSLMIKYPVSVVKTNPAQVASEALNRLTNVAEHVLVHFDVDAIDTDEFPASDVPHKHGLSLQGLVEALRVFTTCPKFVGLVVTELNPELDPKGICARQLVEVLELCLG